MPAKSFITINGRPADISAAPLEESILDFLRRTGLTGSKIGCNEGDCGACTILLLGNEAPPRAINGCLALVHSLLGREILTAEGLATKNGELHPAQQAMIDCNGSQCGYCTPGIVCSLAESSARGTTGDSAAVADQLCGNLCRCTGYRPIREAAASLPADTIPLVSQEISTPAGTAKYHTPQTLEEALLLKSTHPAAQYIVGATEIAVLINKQHLRPELLISLEHIPDLHEFQETEAGWNIGAALPLTDLQEKLKGALPAMDSMLRLFASRQIRHRASLGGNLVTASPIGDSPAVLLALDAKVVLVSLNGERIVPLSEFFTGYRKTVMEPGEILKTIVIPRGLPGRCEFYKVSKRREMDISTVSAGIRIATDDSGIITEVRLAYGGVAATPARAVKTESALLGKPLGAASSDEILGILASEFEPLNDHRATAAYRQSLIRDLFLKYLSGDAQTIPEPVLNRPVFHADAPPHESARGHVTGVARYTHDIALLGQSLNVWLVRSTFAAGKLEAVDVSGALGQPGVHAVLTAEDIPGHNNTGPSRQDEPLFAFGNIEFHGQVIAAVVAETMEQARLAATHVIISCEPSVAIIGIDAAISADSFHTDPHVLRRGEVVEALAQAPQVIEGEFHIGGQEQFYLETHAALAEPDGEGGVFIRSSTQHPSETQTIVAEVLGCARHQVVVECPRMGGGFGGKETQANPWAAICALAALRTGRAVTMQLDRDHDMESSGKRHPFFAKYKVGYHPDGMLEAADIQLFSDGGWSLDLSQPVNDRALFHLDNAYYIPSVRFFGRVCKTNVTSHTAFRGFGGPQGVLVIEEIIGRIAGELGISAEEIRRKNLYRGAGETNTTHYGAEVSDNRLTRIWDELLTSSDFTKRKTEIASWNREHLHTKRGLAITPVKFGISFTLKHYNQAGALVLIYADGSVQVNHGGTEMGQGLHSKILSIAMRELGLSADRIRLMHTRTDKVPNTSATAASSGSDLNGMAVADACGKLKARLATLAAVEFGCAAEEIVFENGFLKSPSGEVLAFSDIAVMAYTQRIQLSATGYYRTPDLKWDWSQENPKGRPFFYYAFGAAVSEVELDGFTGSHHIRRVDVLHDVGDSLNAAIDRGQIEGGFVQGAGWLTSEELKWSAEGRLLTHSASTYAIPSFSDAPLDFRVDLLKNATQKGTIHGSKAVGEPPLMLAISVREALRDAVHAFDGNQNLPSPLTPEVLKLAIGPQSIAGH
ncbi:xanthine dehydrogenase molybdopterin binding subunit [Luteolibacter sp. AS25]|uniref:xanthine dehydrogenase molybdopterin binding subunit n=1 Tax=Luteolibacter sp. AS25 TaxID=3135776 RepID=UPI00398BAF68